MLMMDVDTGDAYYHIERQPLAAFAHNSRALALMVLFKAGAAVNQTVKQKEIENNKRAI